MEPVLLALWPDGGKALGLGRTKMFELAASGELTTVQVGRRRLVPAAAIHDYAARLVANQARRQHEPAK